MQPGRRRAGLLHPGVRHRLRRPTTGGHLIANVIILPLGFASGFFVPLSQLPRAVTGIAPCLPTYGSQADMDKWSSNEKCRDLQRPELRDPTGLAGGWRL